MGLRGGLEVLHNSLHIIIQLAVFAVFAEGGPAHEMWKSTEMQRWPFFLPW